MKPEDEYEFRPECVLVGERGILMVDAKGVVIFQTQDAATGQTVKVCLSDHVEETEALIDVLKHMIEHQREPERKADNQPADQTFAEMMQHLSKKNLH
ncbi:hypothetical protein [Erwinia phage Kuerle]|nr:hypothetical protein [Erwinia phage Kuerle]